MIVLDTNVVSELMRPHPAPPVVVWLRDQPPQDLVTTAVTLAEILYGIRRLPSGQRRDRLAAIATEVFGAFPDRVLPFDDAAADRYAAIVTGRESRGLPIDGFDAQIAAICQSTGADLATRNARDFRHTGVNVVDPWQ